MSQKGAGGKAGELIFKTTRAGHALIVRVHSRPKTWKSWKSNRSEMKITPHPTQASRRERPLPRLLRGPGSADLWPAVSTELLLGPLWAPPAPRGCREMGRQDWPACPRWDGPLQLNAWLPGGGGHRGGAPAGLAFAFGSEERVRAPCMRVEMRGEGRVGGPRGPGSSGGKCVWREAAEAEGRHPGGQQRPSPLG